MNSVTPLKDLAVLYPAANISKQSAGGASTSWGWLDGPCLDFVLASASAFAPEVQYRGTTRATVAAPEQLHHTSRVAASSIQLLTFAFR